MLPRAEQTLEEWEARAWRLSRPCKCKPPEIIRQSFRVGLDIDQV